MLHNIKYNAKHSTVIQSSTRLELCTFGQVTLKQGHFKAFDTTKVYNATFEIIQHSNNSLTEKCLRTFRREKFKNNFIIMTASCAACSKCKIVVKVQVDKTKIHFINVNHVATQSTKLKTKNIESLTVWKVF